MRRPDGAPPFVWGHRGVRSGLPENTLPAFERALDQGAHGVELDVRPCASGEVVVFHDRDLGRIAGDTRKVEALDWETLRAIDLGGGAAVPLLQDALDLVLGAGAAVNVEIKRDVPDLDGLVDSVARVLGARSADERARLRVSSFDRGAIERYATGSSDVVVGLLLRRVLPIDLPPGWGVHPPHKAVSEKRVRRWRDEGRYVATWTANETEDIERVVRAGVDVVISDDVPRVFEVLKAVG